MDGNSPFSLEQDSSLDHNRRYTSRVRRWDELIALDHAKPFMRCQIWMFRNEGGPCQGQFSQCPMIPFATSAFG